MAGLKQVKGYDEYVVNICPNDSDGEVTEIGGLILTSKLRDEEILNYGRELHLQMWQRLPVPEELQGQLYGWCLRCLEFKPAFPYIEQEFKRRREGVWFFNNGERVYITGRHYDVTVVEADIGYGYYLEFQEDYLYISQLEVDRSMGQMYTKCRRSGYTNMSAAILDEATQVKDKLLGIQSKTGKDAQEISL